MASSTNSSPTLPLFIGFPFIHRNNNFSSSYAAQKKMTALPSSSWLLCVATLLSTGPWDISRSVTGSFWELSLRDKWHFTFIPFYLFIFLNFPATRNYFPATDKHGIALLNHDMTLDIKTEIQNNKKEEAWVSNTMECNSFFFFF